MSDFLSLGLVLISGLFLSFDCFSHGFPMLILVCLGILSFPSYHFSQVRLVFKTILNEVVKSYGGTCKLPGVTSFCSVLFCLLFYFNSMGLLPFVYPVTSLPIFPVSLSIWIWITILFMQLGFNFKSFMTHLTPKDCPIFLANALVVIELLSFIIRSLTLGVRLVANLTGGHILLHLMSCVESEFGSFSLQIPLLLLEIMVAFIQSYVFSLLVYMYLAEL